MSLYFTLMKEQGYFYCFLFPDTGAGKTKSYSSFNECDTDRNSYDCLPLLTGSISYKQHSKVASHPFHGLTGQRQERKLRGVSFYMLHENSDET